MIKQIKYNRSIAKIIGQLKYFEYSDGIIEFRIIRTEYKITKCIFYINTEAKWICINTDILLSDFNIKYTSDVHDLVLDFLHYYENYEFVNWEGEDINF